MVGVISRVASSGVGGFVTLENGAKVLVLGPLRAGDRVEFDLILSRGYSMIWGVGAPLKGRLLRKLS